jgi:hypothetical protein
MEGLEQKCQRRRNKRLSRGRVKNDDEFAGQGMQDQKIAACGSSYRMFNDQGGRVKNDVGAVEG